MSKMLDMSGRSRADEIDGVADPDFQDDRFERSDNQAIDDETVDDEDLDAVLVETAAGEDEE